MPTAADLPLDDGDDVEALMRRFYPLILERAYEDATDILGVEVVYDLENPEVQRVIDTLAQKVRQISETTREDIQKIIGRQAAEGWSIERTAEEIMNLAETNAPNRALMIARTESASAFSRGSLLAFQESGVVAGTEWLVADPCPICEAYAGQTRALGEEFGEGIAHPPAHPNCRCAISPVVRGR